MVNALSIWMQEAKYSGYKRIETSGLPHLCFGGLASGGLWNHLGGITKQVEAGRAPSVYLANAKHPPKVQRSTC